MKIGEKPHVESSNFLKIGGMDQVWPMLGESSELVRLLGGS